MASEQLPKRNGLHVDEDGTVHVPAFQLPLSAALSDRSRQHLAASLSFVQQMIIPRAADFANEADFKLAVDAFRSGVDVAYARPMAERLLAAFPVTITPGQIGGVAVEEFTPLEGLDADRVLINLHGGAFYSGAIYVARVESIPVAHRSKLRVVSVDYRQGYEHKHPAACEDITAVYTELLKTYPAERIGIYGGSAGGVLTAQATAWFLHHGLPVPGAIGILGSGTGGYGDSDYFAAIGMGQLPSAARLGSLAAAKVGYFSEASESDPLINPILAPEAVRAKFPPTLLITGTRAFDMSPAIATHRALVQAGVEASLHVFDGLGHCFFNDALSPEGIDAHQTIVRFFLKHLMAA